MQKTSEIIAETKDGNMTNFYVESTSKSKKSSQVSNSVDVVAVEK
jgi:hypothetical protein